MGRWQKRLKKYERHLLLGLVILLLVSFSVTGAITCSQQGAEAKDVGGDFLVSPTKRESVSSNEFLRAMKRLDRYRYRGANRVSLRWPIPGNLGESFRVTWAHLVATQAALASGYEVGDKYALPVGIRTAVQQGMGGTAFTEASYDRFLRESYVGPASDFQDTVREMLLKDAFLRPLVETPGFTIPYEEAYENWKSLLRRVDLQYVALRGDDFTTPALLREKTRERISLQEDVLTGVSRTARTLDGVRAQIEGWRNGHDGTPPESLETIRATGSKDAWDRAFRYAVEEDGYDLRSAGPDGAFDSSDDVTLEVLAHLQTREALREVGEALLRWRGATEAWPETLDAMREAPNEEALPALRVEGKDGWDRVVVYEPAEGEGDPRLFALGADGEAGTDDDVVAIVGPERVIVPPGQAFVPFLIDEDRDAWERPFRLDFAFVATWGWRVTSAGPDGAFDTDDDLDTGNRAEIEAFFRRVGDDRFREPRRWEFEALYVHHPLMPDAVLRALWERHEDMRPNEAAQFDRWRQLRDTSYYMAENPTDPEAGHGAEHARAIAPDATPTLVPDPSIFGEPSPEFLTGDNPDRTEYIDQGWRGILLREGLIENLMNDVLTKARESREAVLAWEEKKSAFDAGEGEDPGEKPEELTFEGLLASTFGDLLPEDGDAPWIGHYVTERPLERVEWESLKHLGGVTFTKNFENIAADGDYAAIPFVLNDSHTKAILRRLAEHPDRMQELDEVYDDVFDLYLKERRLDVAEEALQDLARRYAELSTPSSATEDETPPAEGADEEPGAGEGEEEEGEEEEGEEEAPEEPDVPAPSPEEAWKQALANWSAEQGVPHLLETTGWFVGARPPRSRDLADDVPADEAARIRRQDLIRTSGYEYVRAAVPPDADLPVGTVARDVVRDDEENGTDAVYLVRLLDARFPPPAAFSPRAFADYLTAEIVGGTRGGPGMGPASGAERVVGTRWEQLRNFFVDFDYLQRKFDIRPAHLPELEQRR